MRWLRGIFIRRRRPPIATIVATADIALDVGGVPVTGGITFTITHAPTRNA